MSESADELLELLDRLVAQARPGEGLEAYAVDETETTVTAHGGDVESLSSARTRGVGLRIVDAGRVGYAWTADLGERALAETLAAARDNATVGTPDEANVLAEPGPITPLADLYDPAFATTAPGDKVDLALRLEAAARAADPRVAGVDTARYGDGDATVAIASSAGARAAYRRCDAYVLVEVLAETDGATTSAYGLDLARVPASLDVEAAAAEAAERALRLLGGRKPPSGRVPIVMDPFASASLLGVVAGALSAEAVQKGRSLFAGRVGERVGSDAVTLIDDGRLDGAPASRPFDGEGTPSGRTTLIAGGVLQGWLHNVYTATKDGTRSTGNASRAGYASPPTVAPTNLFLAPGDSDQAALLARAGDGFYCQQVLGVHSGANPISGDFSVGAAGVMIRDGAFAEPVREATIAGTIPEILSGLIAVGSDLRFLPFGGGMGGVSLLIEGMTLAGA